MIRLAIVAALVAGCGPYGGEIDAGMVVAPGSVVSVSLCDASACAIPADGLSRATVTVCGPADHRSDAFDVTLRLSAGRWANPPDPGKTTEYKASLAHEACFSASFVSDVQPGPALLEIDALGTTMTQPLTFAPADIGSIVLAITPPMLGGTTPIMVTATVHASSGGSPSTGTTVAFTTDAPDGGATISPAVAIVDRLTGAATAQISLNALLATLHVTATATPPNLPDAGLSQSQQLLRAPLLGTVNMLQMTITPPGGHGFIPANGATPALVQLTANPEAAGATVQLGSSIGMIQGAPNGTITLKGDGVAEPATASLLLVSSQVGNALVTASSMGLSSVAALLSAGPPSLDPASATLAPGQQLTVTVSSLGDVVGCDAVAGAGFSVTTTVIGPQQITLAVAASNQAMSGTSAVVICRDSFGQSSVPAIYSIP